MSINSTIQERRKELGLTQKQVAEYLNISTPLVSKWENGITSPDVSLLVPLARLLKTDVNTLFAFREDITEQEIGMFCNEVSEIAQSKGIRDGFAEAERKIREYPHNEMLLYCLALQLDGHLPTSGLSTEEKQPYDEKILSWYQRLSKSNDIKISNGANYMIASRLISNGDYDQAQEVLGRMPDIEDINSSIDYKLMLQVSIYQKQGKPEDAAKELQNTLLMTLSKVQMLLGKLVDAELAAGETETAKEIADKASQLPELFDLWNYN